MQLNNKKTSCRAILQKRKTFTNISLVFNYLPVSRRTSLVPGLLPEISVRCSFSEEVASSTEPVITYR